MEHSTQCAINFLKWQGESLQWSLKWLNACPICRGTGYNPQFPENYCLCVLDSKCPRCGALAIIDPDEGVPCYSCGWDWGANEGDVMPEPPTCTCVEERCEDYSGRIDQQNCEHKHAAYYGSMRFVAGQPDDDYYTACVDCGKVLDKPNDDLPF